MGKRENGEKTLGMVPFLINLIYTWNYNGCLLGISPFKALFGVVKQQGALHPKGHASNVRFANVTTWIPKSLECSVGGGFAIPGGGKSQDHVILVLPKIGVQYSKMDGL